jgi:hypothetical protein
MWHSYSCVITASGAFGAEGATAKSKTTAEKVFCALGIGVTAYSPSVSGSCGVIFNQPSGRCSVVVSTSPSFRLAFPVSCVKRICAKMRNSSHDGENHRLTGSRVPTTIRVLHSVDVDGWLKIMEHGSGMRAGNLDRHFRLVKERSRERSGHVGGLVVVHLNGAVMDWNQFRLAVKMV